LESHKGKPWKNIKQTELEIKEGEGREKACAHKTQSCTSQWGFGEEGMRSDDTHY